MGKAEGRGEERGGGGKWFEWLIPLSNHKGDNNGEIEKAAAMRPAKVCVLYFLYRKGGGSASRKKKSDFRKKEKKKKTCLVRKPPRR
jgi:hypothetical protein